jgi:mannosyltransferase
MSDHGAGWDWCADYHHIAPKARQMKYIPAFIFALGIFLRGLFIWQAPLWYDENFTLILARLPFERMMAAIAGDVHPPLWYLVEWITFHSAMWPVWCLRLPALALSILSMVALLRITEEMDIPETVKLTAFGLMAVMPMQIYYAQEARMYAMLEFFTLAAFYNALKRRWILFAIASTALLYTQNYGMFYLCAIWLAVIVRDRQIIKQITAACAVSCFAFLPWLFVLSNQMSGIQGHYWIMDSSGAAMLGVLQSTFFVSLLKDALAIASHIVIYAALMIGVWWMIRKSEHPFKWAVIVMAFGPLALTFIVALLWQPVLLARALIGSSPFLYLMAAWPLEGASKRVMSYAACFMAPLIISSSLAYYGNITAMKANGDTRPLLDVLTYIRANWQAGDVIYHTDDGSLVNFMPYSADLPQYRMDDCAPVLGSLSDATRAALGVHVADLASIPHKRAWVLAPRSPLHPACYFEQIAPLTQGAPLIVVDDNKYIQSGLWLIP